MGSPMYSLARVLAEEVLYRSSRKYRGGRLPYLVGVSSVLSLNLFLAIFLSAASFAIGFILAFGGGEQVPVSMFFIAILLMTALIITYLLPITINFSSVFINERLIEPLRMLPVSETVLLNAYFKAFSIYWGGLVASLAYLPGLTLASYACKLGRLPETASMLGLATCLMVHYASSMLGILLGTMTYQAERKNPLKTFIIVAVLVAAYCLRDLWRGKLVVTDDPPPWAALIPFIGISLGFKYPFSAAASMAITILLVYLIRRLALSKLKAVLALEPPKPVPVIPEKTVEEAVGISRVRLAVKKPIVAFVIKDMRLLSRDSRRLALIIYLGIFTPLTMLASLIRMELFGFLPLFPFLWIFSVTVGSITNILYFIEGAGARLVYYMPVSKKRIFLAKALGAIALSLPGIAMLAVMFYAFTDPVAASLLVIHLVALTFSAAMLFSRSTIALLPREPSQWSEASVYKFNTLAKTFLLSIMFLVLSAAAYYLGFPGTVAAIIAELALAFLVVFCSKEGPL